MSAKRILPLLIALGLAALATWGIIRSTKQSVQASGEAWSVVVAAKSISAGRILGRDDLTTLRFTADQRLPNSAPVWSFFQAQLTHPENITLLVGRETAYALEPGWPITEQGLVTRARQAEKYKDWKAEGLQPGERAISIPVAKGGMVSGLIKVGDHVDIMVTMDVPMEAEETGPITVPMEIGDSVQNFTIPQQARERTREMTFLLLQNVKLLAVGGDPFTPEVRFGRNADPMKLLSSGGVSGDDITVAVEPEEALIFAFASTAAADPKFFLTLRREGDRAIIDPASPENVSAGLYPITYESLVRHIAGDSVDIDSK